MRILAAAALFISLLTAAAAQIHIAPPMSGWGRGGFARPSGRDRGSFGAAFIGEPWFASYPEPASPVPQLVVLQSPAPASRPMEEPKPIEPLMIEWQGDHYARINPDSGTAAGRTTAPLDYSQPSASQAKSFVNCGSEAAADNPECRAALKPTVLVYRDGHREKIAAYSIVGTTLYASDDFWSNGAWTRKIPISSLDLPATIKANAAAGVKFELPSGPNVVIARF